MSSITTNKKILSFLFAVLMALCACMFAFSDICFADENTVDNETDLADGSYKADYFGWSGGSGRLSYIKCKDIEVRDGRSYAAIEFGSSHYDKLKVSGETYYNTGSENSTFEIPVKLNANNTITGRTTAMSSPHWIDYTIYIYSAEAAGETGTKEVALDDTELYDEAPNLIGLKYESETEVRYADLFRIFNYEDDITLVQVEMSSEDTVRNYVIVPEDVELPAGMDEKCTIVTLPAEKIYTTSADISDDLSDIGIEPADISLDKNAEKPDYKSIVEEKTDIAFIEGDAADKEDADTQKNMETQFATLGIPMVISRAEDENGKKAKQEWIKVYGAVLGCQDAAVSYFDEKNGDNGSRWEFWKKLWKKIRS